MWMHPTDRHARKRQLDVVDVFAYTASASNIDSHDDRIEELLRSNLP